MSKRAKQKRAGHRTPAFARREIRVEELQAILERARAALSSEDHEKLKAALDTLTFITQLVARRVSMR